MSRRLHPIIWFRDRPQMFDVLLAVTVLALDIVALVTNPADPGDRHTDALVIIVTAIGSLALVWRRRWPQVVLVVALSTMLFHLLGHYVAGGQSVASLVAAYTFGSRSTSGKRTIPFAAGAIGTLTAVTLAGAAVVSRRELVGFAIGNVVVLATAFLLGDNMRRRRQRLTELRDRNSYLEREQGLLAANAVAAERARIARELHDVVAHSVSVMAIQAGGARRVVHTKPDLAVEALAVIEMTARQTLDELRSMLGILRIPDALGENGPQPGLRDLTTLAQADPDMPVSLAIKGHERTLPAIVDLSAYRIVQEALTNVRKHAGPPPRSVSVDVRYLATSVQVEVTDDGRGAAANQLGGGHGLTGMRERAALCGGQIDAGPRPGGGWLVRATLPTKEPA